MIGMVCWDKNGALGYSNGKSVGDCPIQLAETLTIREAVIYSIQAKHSQNIIKSDSQIAVRAILGDIKASSCIFNISAYIVKLASIFKNVKFSYCTRTA